MPPPPCGTGPRAWRLTPPTAGDRRGPGGRAPAGLGEGPLPPRQRPGGPGPPRRGGRRPPPRARGGAPERRAPGRPGGSRGGGRGERRRPHRPRACADSDLPPLPPLPRSRSTSERPRGRPRRRGGTWCSSSGRPGGTVSPSRGGRPLPRWWTLTTAGFPPSTPRTAERRTAGDDQPVQAEHGGAGLGHGRLRVAADVLPAAPVPADRRGPEAAGGPRRGRPGPPRLLPAPRRARGPAAGGAADAGRGQLRGLVRRVRGRPHPSPRRPAGRPRRRPRPG